MNEIRNEDRQAWRPSTLLGFVMPLTSLGFLLTAPHEGMLVLLWLVPLAASVAYDIVSPAEHRQPAPATDTRDRVLYVLVAIQIVNVVLGARWAGATGFLGLESVVGVFLVGTSSGYSGIVVAHELMHRNPPHQRLLARLLMSSVLYEHFFTEHLRGHHVRVGTREDPATARFGESVYPFFVRTVPGQFRSAWALESERCGVDRSGFSLRHYREHRVLQGLLFGLATLLLFGLVFGPGAILFHVVQSAWAVVLLECVNYFEHWGLRREGPRVRTIDSWDTESSFTLNTLVGLSRHADHHAHASRPYHQLRHMDESPKLPFGYFGMVPYVLFLNGHFRATMTAELRRTGLGPFAADRKAKAAGAAG